MVFLRVSLFGVFFVLWARADSCQVKSVTAARSTPHLFTITRLGSIMAGLLARKQKFSQKNRGGPILPKSILRGGRILREFSWVRTPKSYGNPVGF